MHRVNEAPGAAERGEDAPNMCLAKLVCRLPSERVVGVHYVGPHAGEVIQGESGHVIIETAVPLSRRRHVVGPTLFPLEWLKFRKIQSHTVAHNMLRSQASPLLFAWAPPRRTSMAP